MIRIAGAHASLVSIWPTGELAATRASQLSPAAASSASAGRLNATYLMS
jgi:hypothetical protein